MKLHECDLFDEVFTYVSDELDAEPVTFNITKLRAYLEKEIAQDQLIRAAITPQLANQILRCNGVEQHRVAVLIASSAPVKPIILCDWGTGTHTMIDGNHRFIAAYYKGHDSVLAYNVSLEMCKPFIVEI